MVFFFAAFDGVWPATLLQSRCPFVFNWASRCHPHEQETEKRLRAAGLDELPPFVPLATPPSNPAAPPSATAPERPSPATMHAAFDKLRTDPEALAKASEQLSKLSKVIRAALVGVCLDPIFLPVWVDGLCGAPCLLALALAVC